MLLLLQLTLNAKPVIAAASGPTSQTALPCVATYAGSGSDWVAIRYKPPSVPAAYRPCEFQPRMFPTSRLC